MTKKRKYLIIILTLAFILNVVFCLLPEDLTIDNNMFLRIIGLLDIPGIGLYIMTTGDIHGWKLAMGGKILQIIIMTFGTTLFWWMVVTLILKLKLLIIRAKVDK